METALRETVLRRLLLTIVALLLLGGTVHLALRHFYLDVVFRGGIAERTEAQYREAWPTVRTLVLGDSHPKYGVAAAGLADGFDLALPGQTTPEGYYVLEHEIGRPGSQVRRVVLQADAVTFSDFQVGSWGFLHWYAHRIDYLAIGRARGEPLLYAVRQATGRWAPYIGERTSILRFLETRQPPDFPFAGADRMERGTFLADRSFTRHPKRKRPGIAEGRAKMHFPRMYADLVAVDYLRRQLVLCRERGIGVVLVRFPMTREYLAASMPFMLAARVEEHVAEILEEHPEVVVLDGRFDYLDRGRLFADPDHLNERGARLFTQRVRAALGTLGP